MSQQEFNKKHLKKLHHTYSSADLGETIDKIREIKGLLGDINDNDGVEQALFSLWTKTAKLFNDNHEMGGDYHKNESIHDLAYNVVGTVEDIQQLLKEIIKVVNPLVKLDPDYE